MIIHANTDIETLTKQLLKDVFSKENYTDSTIGKGSFLTGGSVIICESTGLQEYIQKTSADVYGIWTALSFKPLAGFFMKSAFTLLPQEERKDEKDNIFNQYNLIWAIYRLLEGERKTFHFAHELASLFLAYQIYRPKIIDAWNKGKKYNFSNDNIDVDANLIRNEEFQRELWVKIRSEYPQEKDISQLYELFKNIENKNIWPKKVFIFSPLAIAPVQLDALRFLSEAGCKVSLYINQISNAYFGNTQNDKSIVNLRKKAIEAHDLNNKNQNFINFYDIGNKLIANMGKSAQVLYEQVDWDNLGSDNEFYVQNSLLGAVQTDIFNDENYDHEKNGEYKLDENDDSVTMSACFSPLREIEVLSDYLLEMFSKYDHITPCDIAITAPDINEYSSAIDTVFKRCKIPYSIADRDINRYDPTSQALNSLFSIIGTRYEAPDVFALFEYSLYTQGIILDASDSERLYKWISENAIRHGLEYEKDAPNYSFKTGFKQAVAGFFMISQNQFSEKNDYCYPDIEGNSAQVLGDFICFTEALKVLDNECKEPKSIIEWDECFKECFKCFFGTDDMDHKEEDLNPYQKVMRSWDSLKKEMIIGLKDPENNIIDFNVIKSALPAKMEDYSASLYSINGKVSCSNIETVRAHPFKVICCIGMNNKSFPRQIRKREISLMAKYQRGDKDTVNEDRLVFLETIMSAREKLYISWIGNDEKTKDELDPSSCVVFLIKNLEEQYKINLNKIITRHPLQPFSKKYFSGELETYDNRWTKQEINETPEDTKKSVFFGTNIWEWKIASENNQNENEIENEDTINADFLYRCFTDTPKYFLNKICNIYLPEKGNLLDNIEPLIVERGLNEWILKDLIINNPDYLKEIEILKLRGELPHGKFANELINRIIKEAEDLNDKAQKEGGNNKWVYPSKDKGKYRLKHWLKHLEMNVYEASENSKMFLLDNTIELKKMESKDARVILENINNLKKELNEKLLPIFPNSAWKYISEYNNEKNKGNEKEKAIEAGIKKLLNEGYNSYPEKNESEYKNIALKNAESLNDLKPNLEQEFINCSEILFCDYYKYYEKNEKKGSDI